MDRFSLEPNERIVAAAVKADVLIAAVVADFPAFALFPQIVAHAVAHAATMYSAGYTLTGASMQEAIEGTVEWLLTDVGRQTVAGIAWCYVDPRPIG